MKHDRAQLEKTLLSFHQGEITGDDLLRGTMSKWRQISRSIYGKWRRRLPLWIAEEDVLQVVLSAVIRFAKAYDVKRGVTIRWYVSWNAYDKADKAIQQWRNARRCDNAHSEPSRFEVSFSTLPLDASMDISDFIDQFASTAATQEAHSEAKQTFDRAIAKARNLKEAIALLSLQASSGSFQRAAEVLYDDPTMRFHCELMSSHEADHLLARTVHRLKKHLDAEAAIE